MIVLGIQLKPYVSLATVVTVATGALVYHFRIRPRVVAATVETYRPTLLNPGIAGLRT